MAMTHASSKLPTLAGGRALAGIDVELVRAQMLNALVATGQQLGQTTPGGYRMSFLRIRDDNVVFTGECHDHGTRVYALQLVSQDGSHAKLFRMTREGETLPFEACDARVADTIGRYLGPTVHLLYMQMGNGGLTPTHAPPATLQ